ncbi:anthranilate synthase component II [Candidatus Microthrix sp.]|uniref:anthranilate synthase component II n=1 Tax=Candidatus Neomicrothrix sp. TaxID=2719034 RepID=UPI0025930169|nr:aminodeoxychorismate/anthranilate synthase component II [Candidatus Microthrix sp.]HMS47023.1 aminodeoxychorismate/anthranilate synthase component II [Candidatus Microthrix sp.]
MPAHAASAPAPAVGATPTGIVVIDNYDSFTYNLVQYLGELGVAPQVFRNDAVTIEQIRALSPAGVVISPGPGRPPQAGISKAVFRELGGEVPIFGVCLGLQCVGEVNGASVVRAPQVMHGKTSSIDHDGRGVFAGLPNPLVATRYHSLIVDEATVPEHLEISARSDDGLVMGLRHRHQLTEAVQFHPESILTVAGHQLLGNFLTLAGRPAPQPPVVSSPS